MIVKSRAMHDTNARSLGLWHDDPHQAPTLARNPTGLVWASFAPKGTTLRRVVDKKRPARSRADWKHAMLFWLLVATQASLADLTHERVRRDPSMW